MSTGTVFPHRFRPLESSTFRALERGRAAEGNGRGRAQIVSFEGKTVPVE